MGWLDLHLHSKFSGDGEYSPKELLSFCQRDGVRTAAIADHNTTRGILEAQEWPQSPGVTLIPAVELDCTFEEVNLHVLGYWIDPTHPGFAAIEQDITNQEKSAAEERIRLVQQCGIFVDASAAHRIANLGIITGEVIAEIALGQEQNAGNALLEPYRPGGARGDNPFVNFYWDFCSQGKPAYVPIRFISLSEAVELIRSAGGVAVLAHPGNNVKENAPLLHRIVRRGICGLEAYSSYHSPAQTAFYLERARDWGLAVTCGSDFHGKTKPSIRIGSVDCGGTEAELLAGLTARRTSCEEGFCWKL